MSPEARKHDESLLDRLFSPIEEIKAESAQRKEEAERERANAYSLRYGRFGPPSPAASQPVEIEDDWVSNEVGND